MEQEYSKERELLDRFNNGLATPEENAQVNQAFNEFTKSATDTYTDTEIEGLRDKIWTKLPGSTTRPSAVTKKLWPRIMTVAAAVAIIVSVIYLFRSNNLVDHAIDKKLTYANDITPGSNKAILTLANGKTINLSSVKSGIAISASRLTYNDGTALESINIKDNEISTISTPRGGQYNIELPDGTKVALNAASTLKFPSTFLGLVNRTVELAGEGYFQVAKDKKHPFIVRSGDQEVKVLGTHFNINCYPEESATKTTLIEGSVEITALSGTKGSKKIMPGQQAELVNNAIEVTNADTESVLAWKNGDFIFNENIKTIMRQISRWYDVEVVYQGKVSEKEYVGTFSRSKNINEILKALELTKRVHFKVEGRRITVMP